MARGPRTAKAIAGQAGFEALHISKWFDAIPENSTKEKPPRSSEDFSLARGQGFPVTSTG